MRIRKAVGAMMIAWIKLRKSIMNLLTVININCIIILFCVRGSFLLTLSTPKIGLVTDISMLDKFNGDNAFDLPVCMSSNSRAQPDLNLIPKIQALPQTTVRKHQLGSVIYRSCKK